MKGLCKICGKERQIYFDDMCQVCYRKKLSTYKNWKMKPDVVIKNTTHKKIIKMFIKNKVPKEDIAEYFDMTQRNVNIIIQKYCYKCDENGKPMPSE